MSKRCITYLLFRPQACLSLLLSLAVLSSSGCSTNKVAEASKRKAQELVTTFSKDKTPPAESNANVVGDDKQDDKQTDTPQQVKEKRLYIDASESMAGFVGHGGDFDKFFSEIGYVLGDPVVYRFGSSTKSSNPTYAELIKPATLGNEQRSPQFFNLSNNPDEILFNHLNQEGKETLSVYVSDGVYSASDASAGSKVITPLTNWLNAGRVLGIFVLRSPFKGSFYSEKLCSESKGQQCWVQNVETSNRPFYAFVFSPDEDKFRRLQRALMNKLPNLETLVFSDEALTSEGLQLPEADSIYDSSGRAEGYYWQMFTSKLFTAESQARLSFDLKYIVHKEYPLGKISPRISARYYLWDSAKNEFIESEPPPSFKSVAGENAAEQATSLLSGPSPDEPGDRSFMPRAQSPVTMRVTAQVNSSGKTRPLLTAVRDQPNPQARPSPRLAVPSPSNQQEMNTDSSQSTSFQLQIPRDTRSQYGFYYLKIIMEVDAINPGIEDLSTNDDSDALKANRTYRFAEVIRALLEAHLRERLAAQVAPPLFLTVSS